MMILAWVSLPVYADSIEELKTMILQLKDDYESKIQALQAKVDQLEANQELKVSDKVDEIRDQIKEEVKAETLNVEYVGRRQGPVGSGGLLVRNPFGFGDVTLGGYFDTEYRDLAKTDSTFQQHRWIINIGAAMHDKLRFNSELEIEYGGPNTPSSDGEIKVEQAYGDYLINEMVNLRAGALLVPFGRYNLYHDSDLQDLSDRPILARDIIPTTWTEAGYGFFGDMNPSIGSYEDLLLKYEVYVVNGLDTGFSDTGMGGAKNSLKIDNNEGKSIVGRVSVEPISGHEVAFSGYWGDYNKTDDSISGIGMDWLSNWGPLEFVGEYAYFGVEESPTLSSDLANFFQGAYTQFNYHFWPEFLNNTFLGSNFKDPTLTAVTRYDWALISDDSDAGNTNNREDRWTLGLNYRPIDNVVFKFEYQWNRTKSEVLEAGNNDGFITSVAMGF
ncbi:MAG: hypothetical protein A2Y04_04105 [Omnitrophica WOR_2 bacterium GWC2_45_7]|nr:MAG: hypothetical protein A2Y04_04105 [Omnitrophica WOR_2 bacterium GWC2_45_7]